MNARFLAVALTSLLGLASVNAKAECLSRHKYIRCDGLTCAATPTVCAAGGITQKVTFHFVCNAGSVATTSVAKKVVKHTPGHREVLRTYTHHNMGTVDVDLAMSCAK